MAVDILCAPGAVRINEPSPFIEAGKLSTANIKNVMRITQYPFDSTDGAQQTLDVYTRTTPVGDATLAVLPIGSKCEMFTFSPAGTRTAYALYIKVATAATGWAKVNVSYTAPSSVIVAAGAAVLTNTTIQTITVAAATVGDLVFTRLTTASGGAPCTSANANTAGFIVCTLTSAGTAGATMSYQVVRAVTA